ncbi:MAG: transcription antitermination factor NusB [Bacillota bacterium]|nr:transcription antitermination factor NusB [Bacillota bacterium]
MSRHCARETAFRMLFQMDLGRNNYKEAENTMSEALADKVISKRDCDYIEGVVQGVKKEEEKLDQFIRRYSQGWDINRINPVERNIIRLALYETWFLDDVPMEVALNEAVELAKSYGDHEAYSFVNGILDNVKKNADPKGFGEAEQEL